MLQPFQRRIRIISHPLALVLLFGSVGCAGTGTEPSSENGNTATSRADGGKGGGSPIVGGANPNGSTAVGGTTTTGSRNLGGSSGVGDATNTGSSNLGGNTAVGDTTNTGSHSVGGSIETSVRGLGGRVATGGSPNTGGRNLGGSLAVGGNIARGGNSSAGGGVGTGGKNLGGGLPVGGGVATGGMSAIAGSSAGGSPILEPESGAILGLYYGDASIAATTAKLGRALPLHLTYYAWEDDWTAGVTVEDLRAGRIPFVNWELFGAEFSRINSGADDAMITQRATAAKKLGKKLFLDFGAEMNGDWSPWSGAQNGKSSASYVAAYQHVHDIFVKNGATNVIWAFCPNVTSVPDESWNEPLDYYPGDSYVDWTCVDGYNWGTSDGDSSWQSFSQVFKGIYAQLATKKKPIIIGEMASTELGGNKAAWIAQIVPALKTEFPLIKGLLWFDVDKETDWRISSSSAAEAAFKTMANDPWFGN